MAIYSAIRGIREYLSPSDRRLCLQFLSALPLSFAVIEILFLNKPTKRKRTDSVYAPTDAAP